MEVAAEEELVGILPEGDLEDLDECTEHLIWVGSIRADYYYIFEVFCLFSSYCCYFLLLGLPSSP